MLIDTSVLLRTVQVRNPFYETATGAIERLLEQGRKPHIVPQNLVEFWAVATRPVGSNGLGLSPEITALEIARLKEMFEFLPDTPAIHEIWERLVIEYQVCGKPSHDARLVAAMRAHGLKAILTFDRDGFSRYAGIEVVHPADIAGTQSPSPKSS